MGRFQKRKEDFTCNHCGTFVSGTGFTNHCPNCLWSLHVDNVPGDREVVCRGLMEPQRVEQQDGKYRILHVCKSCGAQKINEVAVEDNFEELLRIAQAR